MRCFAAVVVFALLSHTTLAQTGKVVFEESSFNFGVIEEGVDASHTFVFRNTGDAPVTLVHVRPSCGCTTPSWTREAVAPGDSGRVTAVYHSENRPGPFDKGIAVHTDGEPEVLQLRISGDVSPVALEGTRHGNLVVGAEFVAFDRIRVGPPAVTTVRVQNAGDRPIRVDSVLTSAPALFSDFGGTVLQPGQTSEITLILDTDRLASGDEVSHEFTLVTDDSVEPRKIIGIRGAVE